MVSRIHRTLHGARHVEESYNTMCMTPDAHPSDCSSHILYHRALRSKTAPLHAHASTLGLRTITPLRIPFSTAYLTPRYSQGGGVPSSPSTASPAGALSLGHGEGESPRQQFVADTPQEQVAEAAAASKPGNTCLVRLRGSPRSGHDSRPVSSYRRRALFFYVSVPPAG